MTAVEKATAAPRPWEFPLILALALLAGLRIFLSAAAIPFFTNVDEPSHFDLVRKYARGYLPGAESDHFDLEAARQIVLYNSPEIFKSREELGGVPPPLWQAPPAIRDAYVEEAAASFASRSNHEAHSPPVYYIVAGVWHHLGRLAGLEGGSLVYWIRFLNVPLYAGLLVLSYFFIRRFYPGRRFLRIGVPVLLAAFPQDVFFSINSDVLLPLSFLGALYLMLEWSERPRGARGLGIAAGLAAALAFLVKYSNVAILVLLGVVLLKKLRDARPANGSRRRILDVVTTAAAVALPIVAWMAWNYVHLGDALGTAAKTAELGWTKKPLGQLADHPLFTTSGFWFFWHRLIERFWSGEIVWGGPDTLTPTFFKAFFVVVTTIVLIAAAVCWGKSRRKNPSAEATLDGYSLAAVLVSIAFLAWLSLSFDFGNCWYPSRREPYFISGRLILGVLSPFLILVVRAIERLSSRAPRWLPGVLVAALAAVSLLAPLELLESAWPSRYNWFHLP